MKPFLPFLAPVMAVLILSGCATKPAVPFDYTNYKDHMEVIRGHDFAGALQSVWSTMRQMEDDEART
jgi:hypothetical protein